MSETQQYYREPRLEEQNEPPNIFVLFLVIFTVIAAGYANRNSQQISEDTESLPY